MDQQVIEDRLGICPRQIARTQRQVATALRLVREAGLRKLSDAPEIVGEIKKGVRDDRWFHGFDRNHPESA